MIRFNLIIIKKNKKIRAKDLYMFDICRWKWNKIAKAKYFLFKKIKNAQIENTTC